MKRNVTGLAAGLAATAAALAFGAAPAPAQQQGQGAGGRVSAQADLKDARGKPVGKVTFAQHEGGVVVRGELEGLPPGWHAIHVHETGRCEPDFAAAGGHFNPGKSGHGLDGDRPHAGDLPNVFVADDGKARFELTTQAFSLREGQQVAGGQPPASGAASGAAGGGASQSAPSVFDQDGASVVVHAKADDYRTDPAGDSGDRIACGVITRQ
jgi:Cu-Zn family superoxide dismutase